MIAKILQHFGYIHQSQLKGITAQARILKQSYHHYKKESNTIQTAHDQLRKAYDQLQSKFQDLKDQKTEHIQIVKGKKGKRKHSRIYINGQAATEAKAVQIQKMINHEITI